MQRRPEHILNKGADIKYKKDLIDDIKLLILKPYKSQCPKDHGTNKESKEIKDEVQACKFEIIDISEIRIHRKI